MGRKRTASKPQDLEGVRRGSRRGGRKANERQKQIEEYLLKPNNTSPPKLKDGGTECHLPLPSQVLCSGKPMTVPRMAC